MAVERPTFHESWYRVVDLKPRLRASAQVVRQEWRGRVWHVVQDPSGNQFFRLSDDAYRFVALLDGRRTVGEVWTYCNRELGDRAPTQGEGIQLLGQLYAANLLAPDLAPDAESLFERYKKRVRREIGGYMMNFLFARIPLWDPNRFLERWVGVVGWLFSPVGLVLWALLLATGGYHLLGGFHPVSDLWNQARPEQVLDKSNWVFLYLAFALNKALHELGHGFACKKFGRDQHSGGDVHTIGIMFLVFVPMPYVDASSAWLLRSRWKRAVVGAAGMYVELAVAAGAAIVWARTSEGSAGHAIAYNMMFIASVSTILFNANPLLRYDGYYILSDILEIANLGQRSKEYLYYLVRKYAFGVSRCIDPSHTRGERLWLVVYAISSSIYRVMVSAAILLYVSNKLYILGAIMAVGAVVGWVLVPLGKYAHYLATHGELLKTRRRAVSVTVLSVLAIILMIGVIPMPDRVRVEGTVESALRQEVFAGSDGFVVSVRQPDDQRVLSSGAKAGAAATVAPAGTRLMAAVNPELEAQRNRILAQRVLTERKLKQARDTRSAEIADAQTLEAQLADLNRQLVYVDTRLSELNVPAPVSGQWVSPVADRMVGAYLKRGDKIGTVVETSDTNALFIRAEADQASGPELQSQQGHTVRMRVKGRPDLGFEGVVAKVAPTARQDLPAESMAIEHGGSLQVKVDPSGSPKPTEGLFEIDIKPDLASADAPRLFPGQRIVVRFSLPPKPLALQWWRSLRRMVQERFQM